MYLKKIAHGHVGRFKLLDHGSALRHGMSTRKGGVSQPPFDSLNIGLHTDDDPEAILCNRERFFGALHLCHAQLAIPQQIHSDYVALVENPGIFSETDALITKAPGIALTVQVADCVPVFLFDPDIPAIGMVHAGWRGSGMDIALKTVREMVRQLGCDASRMAACIGPSIGCCCYEVGDEVRRAFDRKYFRNNHLDLWRVQRDQLIRAGIPENQIETAGLCTVCHADWFFSHRASGGKAGRMMGVMMIRQENGSMSNRVGNEQR